MGSDQAAARHSLAGGQPRSHAPAYATAATMVMGAAATRTAAVTSQRSDPPRGAQRPQQDVEAQVGPEGQHAASAGRSRTVTRACDGPGRLAAARCTTLRAAGLVR